jgi:hypothetical protein
LFKLTALLVGEIREVVEDKLNHSKSFLKGEMRNEKGEIAGAMSIRTDFLLSPFSFLL